MDIQAQTIFSALEFRKPMMLRNVEPLSDEQLHWIPGPDRKSIAWQLWHIAEVEDNWVRMCILNEPPHFPFEVSLADARQEQYPSKEQLLDYFHSVRELSRQRLEAALDLNQLVTDPDFGQMPAHELWSGVVTSFAWHAGQIALTAKLLPGSPISTWAFTNWTDPGRTSPHKEGNP